jgi:hypothetical protein
VDGAASVTNAAHSGVVTAMFPSTAGTAENPAVIDIKVISGVTAPAAGAVPVRTITENAQYSGTVTWSPSVSGGFALSTAYTATITLTAKSGYTFQGVGQNFFTVAGAISVTNAADSGDVTVVFPSTAGTAENPAIIDINVISGVTAPAAGEVPATEITETQQYTGTVTWSPAVSTVFVVDTVYTATIALTAKTGYTLQGVEENFFTVAKAETVTNAAHSGVITAVFPKVDASFASISAFSAWLYDQPANTAATAYTVKLNDLYFFYDELIDSLKNNPTKYVILDFSDSTFTSIENYVFQNCTSLTSITIPNSVTRIENDVFQGCTSLTAINVDTGNSYYSSQDGVLYNKSKTLLVIYPEGKTGAFTIPDGVTGIEDKAFNGCANLTDITIPDSVTVIGELTFKYCASLTAINVNTGNSNYSSQDGVLYDKNKTLLIRYPARKTGAFIIPDGVTVIGNYTFYGCANLADLTIPNSVTTIGGSAFYYDDRTFSFINLNVTWYYNPDFDFGSSSYYSDFRYNLKTVIIPDSVTEIKRSAFSGCTNLTNVTIPNSVTIIESAAFYGCTSLTNITIPESVTYIGMVAFNNCTSLISITIPDSVTEIWEQAFSGCTSLTSVTIENGVESIDIRVRAFDGCTSLSSVTLGNRVRDIWSDVFQNCTSLGSITIPASVVYFHNNPFLGCTSLTAINVETGHSYFSSQDGVLYYTDTELGKKFLDIYPEGKTNSTFTIPNGVTRISGFAFQNCTNLTSVTIPDSVTSIGDMAFSGCTGLTSVTFQGTIPSEYFNVTSFTGDLRDKYLAGGTGTYTRVSATSEIWMRNP